MKRTLTRYEKALKELRRIGCSHASGDTLRAMYAKLIPPYCCLAESTAGKFFDHLCKFGTDSAIHKVAVELLHTPLEACEIGLA